MSQQAIDAAIEPLRNAITELEHELEDLEQQRKEKKKQLRNWKSSLRKLTGEPAKKRKPRVAKPSTPSGGGHEIHNS